MLVGIVSEVTYPLIQERELLSCKFLHSGRFKQYVIHHTLMNFKDNCFIHSERFHLVDVTIPPMILTTVYEAAECIN